MDGDISTVAEFLQKKSLDPVDEVKANYNIAEKHLRASGKYEIWEDIFRYYHGYLKSKLSNKLVPNFHMHKLFPAIETSAARFALSYFANTPFITIDPRSRDSVDSAPKLEKTVQYYLENTPDFYLSTMRLVKYCQLYGVAFRVPSWRREKRMVERKVPIFDGDVRIGDERVKREEVIYDGLQLNTYGPTEVFINPFTRYFNKAGWVILEEYVPLKDILDKAKMGFYDIDKVNKIPLNGSGQDNIPYHLRLEAIGQSKPEPDHTVIRLWHQLSNDSIKTIANEQICIRDIDNPIETKRMPIVMASQIIDVDSMYPISQGELILPTQKMFNLLNNASTQVILNNLHPVWKYKIGKVDPDYLVSLPNHKIPMHGNNLDDAEIMNMPEMKSDIMLMLQLLASNMEETVGMFGPQKGYSTQKHTATSDSIFQQEGNKRIEFDVMTLERLALIPEAELIVSLILQNMGDSTSIKVSGSTDFVDYDPEELRGQYKYKVGGASQAIARGLIHQQLVSLYEISSNAQQYVRMQTGELVPVPVLNVYNGIKELYQSAGHSDIERYLYRTEVFGIPVDSEMFKNFGLNDTPDEIDNLQVNPEATAQPGNLMLPNQNNVRTRDVINNEMMSAI